MKIHHLFLALPLFALLYTESALATSFRVIFNPAVINDLGAISQSYETTHTTGVPASWTAAPIGIAQGGAIHFVSPLDPLPTGFVTPSTTSSLPSLWNVYAQPNPDPDLLQDPCCLTTGYELDSRGTQFAFTQGFTQETSKGPSRFITDMVLLNIVPTTLFGSSTFFDSLQFIAASADQSLKVPDGYNEIYAQTPAPILNQMNVFFQPDVGFGAAVFFVPVPGTVYLISLGLAVMGWNLRKGKISQQV